LRRSKNLLKTILKSLYKIIGLAQGELLGEQLLSLDKSAGTLGLQNWVKKEYR
jgi:hypothetical protein